MYCTTANLSRISLKDALNEAIRRLQAMCILSPELDEDHSEIITGIENDNEVLYQVWTINSDHIVRLTARYDTYINMYACTISLQSKIRAI
jgi:hypothetical protein